MEQILSSFFYMFDLMKKNILLFLALLYIGFGHAQETTTVFKKGEWLRFKMSYSGFLRAGSATLSVDEAIINDKEVFHVTGKGWTSGVIKWFFKVDDTYESFFNKETIQPYVFIRNINEGGYIINRKINFDYSNNIATTQDFKSGTTSSASIEDIQDMLSAFYYLRTQNLENLNEGDEIGLNMFIDGETFPFKLRFLGTEFLKTSFGKVKTLLFRPMVQAGRIFKANESVTIWITADANKIPIKLKASLAVGSLRAELEAYKGLANSFEIIYD